MNFAQKIFQNEKLKNMLSHLYWKIPPLLRQFNWSIMTVFLYIFLLYFLSWWYFFVACSNIYFSFSKSSKSFFFFQSFGWMVCGTNLFSSFCHTFFVQKKCWGTQHEINTMVVLRIKCRTINGIDTGGRGVYFRVVILKYLIGFIDLLVQSFWSLFSSFQKIIFWTKKNQFRSHKSHLTINPHTLQNAHH
jgi:hypothetical protein